MALTDKLTAIANAIRAKTGRTATMTLTDMVTEIGSISGGGGASSGSVTFTDESQSTVTIDVGADFSNFLIVKSSTTLGYGVRVVGFAFEGFDSGLNFYCYTNAPGTAWSAVGFGTGSHCTKSGTSVTVPSTAKFAPETYLWYAW